MIGEVAGKKIADRAQENLLTLDFVTPDVDVKVGD